VGADLCSPLVDDPKWPPLRTTEDQVTRLEGWCDEYSAPLSTLDSFILPGGTPGAALLHVARTVTRRAERRVWSLVEADPDRTNPLAAKYPTACPTCCSSCPVANRTATWRVPRRGRRPAVLEGAGGADQPDWKPWYAPGQGDLHRLVPASRAATPAADDDPAGRHGEALGPSGGRWSSTTRPWRVRIRRGRNPKEHPVPAQFVAGEAGRPAQPRPGANESRTFISMVPPAGDPPRRMYMQPGTRQAGLTPATEDHHRGLISGLRG
jgi:hypothetical protein